MVKISPGIPSLKLDSRWEMTSIRVFIALLELMVISMVGRLLDGDN